MSHTTDPGDLEAMKSVVLDIISRVEREPSGSAILPNGVNDIYIRMDYRGAALEVELSTAKKIHEPRRPEDKASARSS